MIYKKFFAAANSAYGFKSYFEELFFGDDIKKRYIIKGGAGTGKSTFLKALAAASEKLGHDTELYYCSSDPNSLDGVIIRDMGICAIDATSPHAHDCKYVGCVDVLLDVTQFLKREKLFEKTSEIKRLSDESARNYKSGYKNLAAAGKLADELYESGREHIDMQKLEKTALRLTKVGRKREKGLKLRLVTAINAYGKTTLTDYFSEASRFYFIDDAFVLAPLLLKKLEEYSGGKAVAFPNPLVPDRYEAIYLEESKILISAEKELLPKKFTRINAKSFYDGYYTRNREKIKFQKKLIGALTDMACENFANAKKKHDSLEKINVSAMDFSAMQKWSNKLIKEILSEKRA